MYKRNFYIVTLTCLVLILGIALFNWLINPFLLFDQIELDKINRLKPATDLNERLSKTYEVIRQKPAGLVLGNSRALAFSTAHPGWSHKNNYNLALSNGSMYEALRYFQHANSTGHVKEVVLSLAYRMFMPGAGYPLQYNDRRLKVDSYGLPTRFRFLTYLKDTAASTLSMDATRASIRTLQANRRFASSTQANEATQPCSAAKKDHARIKAHGGHAKFFLHINKDLLRQRWPYLKSVAEREKYFNDSMQYFTNLIRIAYQQNIKLHVIIPPDHALLNETWFIAGLWPAISNWKHYLIDINEFMANEYKQPAYPIWDFSTYNTITTEHVPAWDDSDTPMKWFWETLHFKGETAYLILDRIFNQHRADCRVPNDFGVIINKQNINAHIEQINRQHLSFEPQYPEHIKQLKLFAKTLEK